MTRSSPIESALAWAAKAHKLQDALVLDQARLDDPATGQTRHWFRVAGAAEPNGLSYEVIVDAEGRATAGSRPDEVTAGHEHPPAGAAAPAPAAAITISPDTNTLVLNPTDTLDETLTVTVPKSAGVAKADVYFLADTTGSMEGILAAVHAGANNVLTALNGLGVDLAYGVGNYKDFGSGDPYCFQHQLNPTATAATVAAAINTWAHSGGGDLPEGAFFALDRLATPPAGPIGWRAGAKRIVVWFGDAPAHDPVCTAISGAAAAITEASVTAKLTAEGIVVLAISTAKPGLDGDPKLGATDYTGPCGAPGGTAGQATRIAAATGGAFVTGINAGNIVDTIVKLVSGAVGQIGNLKLVPSPTIAPFITSITPAAGYGPLDGAKEHTLKFEVRFHGIPCKPEPQVVNGSIDVVADGAVVAAKRVQITVPACAPREFVYAVKFVCGTQPACDCQCAPVRPGRYATEINLLNAGGKEVKVRKRFIPVVLAGAPLGREPRSSGPRAEDKIVLPPHSATMDDCCRVHELLFGAPGGSAESLCVGFVEITSSAELVVTAVYTSSGLDGGGVAIDVQQVTPTRAS